MYFTRLFVSLQHKSNDNEEAVYMDEHPIARIDDDIALGMYTSLDAGGGWVWHHFQV